MRRLLLVLAASAASVIMSAAPASAQHMLKGFPASNPCMQRAKINSAATPPESCAKAIAAATNPYGKADLHFYWAYSLADVGNYEAALINLDTAANIAPDFVNAYFERSYAYAMLGEFQLALADADKAVQLAPGEPGLLIQRAFSRSFVGDYAGELADCDKAINMAGKNAQLLLCKGEALFGLGRYAEAEKILSQIDPQGVSRRVLMLRADVKRMKGYKPKANAADLCAVHDSLGQKDADKLIANCTWAILTAKSNEKKSDFLTYRAMARVALSYDMETAKADLALAAALDPQNPEPHFNYGSAVLAAGSNQTALREFNKALSLSASAGDFRRMVLLGRSDAHSRLGNPDAALADATEADQIKSSPDSQNQLGQLAYDRGDKDKARLHWLSAWRMGLHDDALRANLRRVGVDDPNLEKGK